jgi:tRNA U34 2-thiouridine synthase MnmA/TrmU
MKQHSVIVMFSGGLDSVMAVHLLKSQGLSVTALHFLMPFYSGLGRGSGMVGEYAAALGVPLRVEEEGDEFLEMVRSPKFGFGKNANPCVDCRIHRLQKAARIVEEAGAVCLATGEVAGQRPMSQKLHTLQKVEKLAGLTGKLLRPLSAKLLAPTDAEIAGIIDREKLLDISGRSRAVQLAYAKQHGLSHSSPAGGCLLTNIETGARFMDLMSHDPQFTLTDFKLLAYGRHFRTSPEYRAIISRDDTENDAIEKIIARGGLCRRAEEPAGAGLAPALISRSSANNILQMYLRDTTGPIALGIGEPTESDLQFSASAVVRFSKMRTAGSAAVIIKGSGEDRVIDAKPADESLLNKYRISSSAKKS